MKRCKRCGVEFRPSRAWQEFHSSDCQQRWHREEQRRIRALIELEQLRASEQGEAPRSPSANGNGKAILGRIVAGIVEGKPESFFKNEKSRPPMIRRV